MPYTVEWTEVSSHKRVLSDEEMADLIGVTVDELAAMEEDEVESDLPDLLAELEDGGFEGLEREIDELIKH
ncbi:hypothetical protein ABZ348_31095 [Streptomyces sp. NPDC005963]|uniref:hypothetical protein n=1 Tax=Streptomyces sp. NPDC005963 TaxID=3156721 RepID=UPI0033ECD997